MHLFASFARPWHGIRASRARSLLPRTGRGRNPRDESEPPNCGNAQPPPVEPVRNPSPGRRRREIGRAGPPPEACKSPEKMHRTPAELSPKYKSPKKVHRPAVSGSGSNPRSRDGGVPRAPPRPGTRPARCPSAPRAGRANRARIAGCAENRPECISRQENDHRCAENRPKCISWHGSAGTRRERTVRGRLLTSGETAGRTGAVIFLARWTERFGSRRRRRRAEIEVPENTLWPIFSTIAPYELPKNTLCPIFSTSCGRCELGRAAASTAPVRNAPPRTERILAECGRGQNSRSLEGGITENAPLWSKPAFTGGKRRGTAANSRPRVACPRGGCGKTPVQEAASGGVVKTCVFCTYSEGQF